MLEAPQLLWAHVLVLLRLTGKIFLGLNGISFSSCLLHQPEAKMPNITLIKSSNSQQSNNQKLCISMCVCILNLTSSALQTDQCVVTSSGSNSLSYLARLEPILGTTPFHLNTFKSTEEFWKYTVLILMHYNHYCMSQLKS